MLVTLVVGLSFFLQIITIFFALKMIPVTGPKKAWVFLSIGIATMGLRRLMSFIYLLADGTLHITELGYEIIGLAGSAIMLAGVVSIKPIFLSIKSSEEALRESEANLKKAHDFTKNILDTIDEAFVVIDREYTIVSANQAYLNKVGMPMEAIIGSKCHKASHHLSRPCYETGEDCSVRQTFMTCQPYTANHTHMDAEGNNVYVETKSYPLKDDFDNTVSVIQIIIDITEKRKLEEQLRQAQKLEAIGELAGGIAHDFNNMLTAIIGYGSLLKSNLEEDSPLKPHVEHILSSAEKSANLTGQLLAFSRKQVISPKQVDLNGLIRGMDKLLQRVIGEDIELQSTLSDKDLFVMVDPGQIEQVFMNLITNARDAMPNGGLLSIRTEKVQINEEYGKTHDIEKTGAYALVSITDTGLGMDEKTRQRIFEPFFTTKEMGRGTGLGLSLVYGIVKQHNGNVYVYSEPGKGTTFKIYLPLVKSPVSQQTIAQVIIPKGGTETMLVAEDNEDVRLLTKKVLEQFGYKVIEAVDGEDAINKFEENKECIQLVLLDVIMPKKSGKEAGDEIKKIKPDAKILFISGYTADIIHKRGILEERTDFISKPVTPQVLLAKIREILDRV